mmetsp:Transcript_22910/g.48752  ORF Transcript_22910/g.48752 Transcript_22910/m.48752 type:complete len:327 (+) Transcript_22910:105-1085(+)|eukprot:CAMPEP_0201129780 /NCGR_PEP_ID=MMETSP0850-20130426/38018_1 /ASSEMBLY_ACC=CAM_ASM_000622 /TAXON_ID=183588 /ORGANISM="Pseudo-nitzschia fraudulenta, Strain WWA7" /LENGTH=326 /DNA_ID=CAMNT_0047399357 /DNA_START=112 /DNA_END=1092 /DNA_ORIENTATION=+
MDNDNDENKTCMDVEMDASTSTCSNVSLEEDHPHPHHLAQLLNNHAAFLMVDENDYKGAINLLSRAIELSKWDDCWDDCDSSTDGNTIEYLCEHCTLEASLFNAIEKNDLHYSNYTATSSQNETFYVYHQPLLVSQCSIDEGHWMGDTLSFIILFNLALAHQLEASTIVTINLNGNFAETTIVKTNAATYRTQALEKAVKLYKLSIDLHDDCIRQQQCQHGCECNNRCTLRLKLIVLNNLGEVHRLAGNTTKYEMSMEFLLKAMMYASHGHVGGYDNDSSSSINSRHAGVVYGNQTLLTPEEVDGFFRNIQSSSILQGAQIGASTA